MPAAEPTDVVVRGAGSPLGQRVVAAVAADPAVARVVLADRDGVDLTAAIDAVEGRVRVEIVSVPAWRRWRGPGERTDGWSTVLTGAGTIVDLGATVRAGHAATVGRWGLTGTGTEPDPAATAALLDEAEATSVTTVVVLSSALVYGAWPDNALPLTEDALPRPHPDLAVARAAVETEQRVQAWRDAAPRRRAVVLRPALVVAGEQQGWLGRSSWSPRVVADLDAEAPRQFLHLDDLVGAIDLARRDPRLDGVRNVAPPGWLDADSVAALAGPVAGVSLPTGLATLVRRRAEDVVGPGVAAHRRHPWVVAADRLGAEGWVPSHRNEEAYVDADAGGPFGPLTDLDARHRQALAIGAVVAGVAGAVAGVLAGLRHRHR
jgi:nucleoside-diphosphate-sugar epimerase